MQELTTTNKCNQGGSMKVNSEQLKWIIQKVCAIDTNAKVKFVGRIWQSSTDESDFNNHEFSTLKSIKIKFGEDCNDNTEVQIELGA